TVMATRPPPATPSISSRSSSACIASILDFNSVACFIKPRKSAIVIPAFSGSSRQAAAATAQADGSQCIIVGNLIVALWGCWRFVPRLSRRSSRRTDLDYFGAGKALQHRLHQWIAAHAVLEFGFARFRLSADRGRAGFCRYRDHPAAFGPLRELLRKLPDQGLPRSTFKRKLDLSVLEPDEPHVAFERALDRKVALLGRKCNQIGEIFYRPNVGGVGSRCADRRRRGYAHWRRRSERRSARSSRSDFWAR